MTFEEICAKRMARYENFDKGKTTPLEELTKDGYPDTYGKFIKKGGLKLHDYHCGLYDLHIKQEGLDVIAVFLTLDDGELLARTTYESTEKANEVLHSLLNIFKDMEECPSDADLNKLVSPLGLKFEYE